MEYVVPATHQACMLRVYKDTPPAHASTMHVSMSMEYDGVQ
jgi:hypothetical protein